MTFLRFIKRRYCDLHLKGCRGYDHWDGENGEPVSTVCHIKTRGSGGEDHNNVISACIICHSLFENWPKTKKQQWLPLAESLTKEFYERV